MSATSNKLYKHKKSLLRTDINNTGIGSEEELLLLEAPKETDEIFRELEMKSRKDFVLDQMKDTTEMSALSKKFNGAEPFKGQYIKDIADKYFLQCLSVHRLAGYLPDEAAQAILDFLETNKHAMKSDSTFYILCDRDYFINKKGKGKGEQVKTCIIFYRDKYHDGGGMYTVDEDSSMVQVWSSGDDFSEWKRFKYMTTDYSCTYDIPPRYSNLLIILIYIALAWISLYSNVYGVFIGFTVFFILAMVKLYFSTKHQLHWND